MKKETIAAVATAMSNSGIGIVRISGEEAITIVDSVFKAKKKNTTLKDAQSHTLLYGFIHDGDRVIDEVMIAIMKAPNSYTKEDTVEIDCHGGILVINEILSLIIKNGARLAEPGEFTKRAFLNGRIDLSKAEAVMDLISSQNEFAMKSSMNQLKGALSDKVKEFRAQILYEIAFIESALDDPEHISLDGYEAKLEDKLQLLLREMHKLINTSSTGKILKDGINTVIVGKPNAGKSSLLNKLVGEEKAIVTDIAGTTRDALEENIHLRGIGLNIIDTAGIRSTEDFVEKIGVGKAKQYAKNADLIVYVVDASTSLDDSDEQIFGLIPGKKVIALLNKADLTEVVTENELKNRMKDTAVCRIIKTSMQDNTGLKEFEEIIHDLFVKGDISLNDEIFITNIRHKEALEEAVNSLELVCESLKQQMPEDFLSIDLMNAYKALGKIIGEEIGEDLVNEIFSKFCMGK